MNCKELAATLNAMALQYPVYLPTELTAQAKAAGLVIVMGASDDLMEFEGAIHDEVGAGEETVVMVDTEGLQSDWETLDRDDKDIVRDHFAREGQGLPIIAHWSQDGYSWTYSTDIPHETFEVMEDGEKYCRGIVFALADAKK